jgi:hypothetical protein
MPGEMGFGAGTERLLDDLEAVGKNLRECEQKRMDAALAFVKRVSTLRAAMNRAVILLNDGGPGTDLLALGLLADALKKDEEENKH